MLIGNVRTKVRLISISSMVRLFFVFFMVMLYTVACSKYYKAPETNETRKVVYLNDIKEIFDSNCISCHSGGYPPAGYDLTTYDSVITRAVAGDSSSALVVESIEGGSMHNWYDSKREIEDVVRWVVVDSLAKE